MASEWPRRKRLTRPSAFGAYEELSRRLSLTEEERQRMRHDTSAPREQTG